jgi:hypothetical protein
MTDIRIWMHEVLTSALHPQDPEDDRTRVSDATRARMAEKGLQFPLPRGPLTVIMQDDIQHTAAFPVCSDPNCICYTLEREKIIEATTPHKRQRRQKLVERNYEQEARRNTAQLNGPRPFNLMR